MLSFYLHVHGGKNVFVSVWLCGTGCVFLYVCKDSFFLLSFIFGVRGEKMCLCLGVSVWAHVWASVWVHVCACVCVCACAWTASSVHAQSSCVATDLWDVDPALLEGAVVGVVGAHVSVLAPVAGEGAVHTRETPAQAQREEARRHSSDPRHLLDFFKWSLEIFIRLIILLHCYFSRVLMRLFTGNLGERWVGRGVGDQRTPEWEAAYHLIN